MKPTTKLSYYKDQGELVVTTVMEFCISPTGNQFFIEDDKDNKPTLEVWLNYNLIQKGPVGFVSRITT